MSTVLHDMSVGILTEMQSQLEALIREPGNDPKDFAVATEKFRIMFNSAKAMLIEGSSSNPGYELLDLKPSTRNLLTYVEHLLAVAAAYGTCGQQS